MKNLQNFIREEIVKDKKKLREEFKDIIDIISNYIIKHKLIVYGGAAINEYLPKKDKIYSNDDIPDLDCLSSNAVKHILKIADELYDAGHKYIKIMSAEHKNTYRLSVNFKFIFDITDISPSIYDKMIQSFNIDQSGSQSKFVLAPLTYVIGDLYWEMSSPVSSIFRWEKVYKRLLLMLSHFGRKNNGKIENSEENIDSQIINLTLDFVKKNKYPLTRLTAMKIHIGQKINDGHVSILSTEVNKTLDAFKKIMKDHGNIKIVEKRTSFERLPSYKIVYINNKRVLQIFDASDICLSITRIKGYHVCTAFGVLSFLYYELLLNPKANTALIESYIYHFEKYVQSLKDDVKKITNAKCYGKQKKRNVKLAELWNEEPQVLYKSPCT